MESRTCGNLQAVAYCPGCPTVLQEVALRDDTLLFEDTAGALHVALNRAEAWCRASAGRAGLLAETAVSLNALSSYEASYTHNDAATTQALASTAQVCRVSCVAVYVLIIAESYRADRHMWLCLQCQTLE